MDNGANGAPHNADSTVAEAYGASQIGPFDYCPKLGFREYWYPGIEARNVRGKPVSLTMLGEDLVLFRAEDGAFRLCGRFCPHRGTDLSYGRLEHGGLRCLYHGWLFDGAGRCLEQPAEPAGSTFHAKIRHAAYPCVARNGIVFAYLGAGAPPPLPSFDCFAAPPEHAFAYKGFIDCNWLQLLEGGIDPAHVSFLHRFFEDDDGKMNRSLQEVGGAMLIVRALPARVNARLTLSGNRMPSGSRSHVFLILDAEFARTSTESIATPSVAAVNCSILRHVSTISSPAMTLRCHSLSASRDTKSRALS